MRVLSAPPATARASARRGSGCVQRRHPVTTTGRRPGPQLHVAGRVYPRMCGGKSAMGDMASIIFGLSPHVRGKGWPRRRRRPILTAPRGSCQHHRRRRQGLRSPGHSAAASFEAVQVLRSPPSNVLELQLRRRRVGQGLEAAALDYDVAGRSSPGPPLARTQRRPTSRPSARAGPRRRSSPGHSVSQETGALGVARSSRSADRRPGAGSCAGPRRRRQGLEGVGRGIASRLPRWLDRPAIDWPCRT